MKRVLLSIAILMFLAAGIGGWLLYSFSEKAIREIEESIIDFSELEPGANESSKEEGPVISDPSTAPGAAGPKAANDKSTAGSSLPAPPGNTGGSAPDTNSEDNALEQTELVKDVKSKVSISERASLTKLVLSRLTKSDISELKGMLSNGITGEEKERAKAILYSRLSAEEINRIKEAYIKYTQ